MKQISILTLLFLMFSCGDSSVEKLQYSVSGKIEFTDSQYWPTTDQIYIALYSGKSKLPTYSVKIQKGKSQNFLINNVKEGTYKCKLVVTNQYKISRYEMVNYGDITINSDKKLESQEITLITINRIQKQIFNKCIMCHGGASEVAGDLYLTEGKSYSNLVNVESKYRTAEGNKQVRVKPSDSNKSFIINVLNQKDITFDHSSSSTATPDDIELITNWINLGAKK